MRNPKERADEYNQNFLAFLFPRHNLQKKRFKFIERGEVVGPRLACDARASCRSSKWEHQKILRSFERAHKISKSPDAAMNWPLIVNISSNFSFYIVTVTNWDFE
jgi:hypothetical protein